MLLEVPQRARANDPSASPGRQAFPLNHQFRFLNRPTRGVKEMSGAPRHSIERRGRDEPEHPRPHIRQWCTRAGSLTLSPETTLSAKKCTNQMGLALASRGIKSTRKSHV